MRIRITFGKTGALRYIGHLDLHKLWERASRRAGLALTYSQGFHPQPKIQLASALPLGFSSRCELVDLWIDGTIELSTLPKRLALAVPPGLSILGVAQIDEKSPPLQTQVVSAEYEISLQNEISPTVLLEKIRNCLSAETLPRERRGKPYDLRPLIESIMMLEPVAPGLQHLRFQLASREGATGRPEEVLDALGLAYEDARVERCGFQFLKTVTNNNSISAD